MLIATMEGAETLAKRKQQMLIATMEGALL
jgi:hypothetical protein